MKALQIYKNWIITNSVRAIPLTKITRCMQWHWYKLPESLTTELRARNRASINIHECNWQSKIDVRYGRKQICWKSIRNWQKNKSSYREYLEEKWGSNAHGRSRSAQPDWRTMKASSVFIETQLNKLHSQFDWLVPNLLNNCQYDSASSTNLPQEEQTRKT